MLIDLRDRAGYEALGKTDEAVKSYRRMLLRAAHQPAQV